MGPQEAKSLLEAVRDGQLPVEDGLRRLSAHAVSDLGHTRLDTHRELRCGHPEVVYGAGKTPEQLVDIALAILSSHDRLLVTRATPEGGAALTDALPAARQDAIARTVTVELPADDAGMGNVLVVSAGPRRKPPLSPPPRSLAISWEDTSPRATPDW